MTKSSKSEWARFLIAGAVNTVATYVLYLALLKLVEYRVAFTISFIIGIVVAYTLNAWFVFRTRWSILKLFGYPVVYLVQYGLGLLLLTVEVDALGIDRRFAPFINVILLLPLTFFLNRWFLTRKGRIDQKDSVGDPGPRGHDSREIGR